MSSPFNSMDASSAAHSAHALVIDPHVATAIWALILAVACALVLIIAEIVKQRSDTPAEARRDRPKKPPR